MRWSNEEIAKLKDLYPKKTLKELSDVFQRSVNAVANKCNELGLKGRGCSWKKITLSPEDRLWFKLNYPYMSNEICGYRLGCGWRTVVRIARSMGLEKSPKFMKEAQSFTAKKAKESHLKNGTYPPRGWYSPNLQKGERYQFKKNGDRQVGSKGERGVADTPLVV